MNESITDRRSEASTAYRTEASTVHSKQPLIEKVDVDEPEGNFFEWQEKQLDYLKLPVFRPPPRSAQRAFSTERSRKAKAADLTPVNNFVDDSSDDCQSEQSNQMNKSAYVVLPSAMKTEGDEEELDPLMRQRQ